MNDFNTVKKQKKKCFLITFTIKTVRKKTKTKRY